MSAVIFLVFLVLLANGLMLIFAKDTAWSMTKWQNSSRGLASVRSDQWDTITTTQGIVSIVLALGSLFFLLSVPSRNTSPNNTVGTSTMTIDGRPATPEEQRMIEGQINKANNQSPAGNK